MEKSWVIPHEMVTRVYRKVDVRRVTAHSGEQRADSGWSELAGIGYYRRAREALRIANRSWTGRREGRR